MRIFGRDPRKKAILERAMKQVEHVLKDMQDQGMDLQQLKLKRYYKTHFSTCRCPKCMEAQRKNNPHLRGILEDGVKVYVGEGAGDE